MYMSRKVAYLDERWGWLLPSTVKFYPCCSQSSYGALTRDSSTTFTASVTQDNIDDDLAIKSVQTCFGFSSSNFQLNHLEPTLATWNPMTL